MLESRAVLFPPPDGLLLFATFIVDIDLVRALFDGFTPAADGLPLPNDWTEPTFRILVEEAALLFDLAPLSAPALPIISLAEVMVFVRFRAAVLANLLLVCG